MDRRFTIGFLIALPIMFLVGTVLFGRLSDNDDTPPTVQPTQEPASSGLRRVVVQGTEVAIEPDSRQLIIENEPPPLYAIGITAPANTPLPTLANIPPTSVPNQQIVEVTRIVEVTQIVQVTQVIEVTATPSSPSDYVIPQVTFTPAPTPIPAPNTANDGATINYVVQPGDTLSTIAQRFGLDFNLIVAYNGYRNLIYPGDVIVLPRVGDFVGGNQETPTPNQVGCTANDITHTVQQNDTVYSLSARYGASVEAIRQRNGLGFNYLIYPEQLLCIPR